MDDTDNPGLPQRPGLLSGWKEIAAYLGRGVRTVQRWERYLALPIHRIPTPRHGQIIYAVRDELDVWRASRAHVDFDDRAHPEVPGDVSDYADDRALPGVPVRPWFEDAVERVSSESRGRRRLLVPIGLAVAVVLLVGVGLVAGEWLESRRVAAEIPASFRFQAHQLLALDRGGRVIWSHDFGVQVTGRWLMDLVAMPVDLDDDGQLEYVAAVGFGPDPNAPPTRSDALFCFNSHGDVRWSVTPQVSLNFGGEEFRGPWRLQSFTVSQDGPNRKVWAAFSHHTWRPAFVLEIGPDGTHSMRYVQSGWIWALASWQTPEGSFLAAGGVDNERERPSLALVSLSGEPAHSPNTAGSRDECRGCLPGVPDAYFLFPRSEVTAASRTSPYGYINTLHVVGDRLKVRVHDTPQAARIGFVSPDLQIHELEGSDAYWAEHRNLEDEGRIGHTVENCPERTTPREVRVWRPGDGWTSMMVFPKTTGSSIR